MEIPLSIYQIGLSCIAVLFLVDGVVKIIKKGPRQSFVKSTAIIGIWSTILAFTIYPEITHIISQKLGLGENLNTLIFLGFIIVFILIFRLIHMIDQLEQSITEIVRAEALHDLREEKKKKGK